MAGFDWAALGLPTPRAVRLTPAQRSRLTHMTELRDITRPADADRAAAEFASEAQFAGDLRRVRPWLAPDTPRRAVLAAVLHAEGTGFLALLGEYGPWVYAASVRDLQELGGAYGALVHAAHHAPEDAVYAAAAQRPDSLLTRLEATDHRQPGRGGDADLAALEAGFWHAAAVQAQTRYAAHGQRRAGGTPER